jgi:hypothetical protein
MNLLVGETDLLRSGGAGLLLGKTQIRLVRAEPSDITALLSGIDLIGKSQFRLCLDRHSIALSATSSGDQLVMRLLCLSKPRRVCTENLIPSS